MKKFFIMVLSVVTLMLAPVSALASTDPTMLPSPISLIESSPDYKVAVIFKLEGEYRLYLCKGPLRMTSDNEEITANMGNEGYRSYTVVDGKWELFGTYQGRPYISIVDGNEFVWTTLNKGYWTW